MNGLKVYQNKKFKNNWRYYMNKIVIITPAYRINNLQKIKESINFNKIFKWIIIYDKEKNFKGLNKSKDNSKIIELYYRLQLSHINIK